MFLMGMSSNPTVTSIGAIRDDRSRLFRTSTAMRQIAAVPSPRWRAEPTLRVTAHDLPIQKPMQKERQAPFGRIGDAPQVFSTYAAPHDVKNVLTFIAFSSVEATGLSRSSSFPGASFRQPLS
jgi:hypothetical protein